MNGVSHYAATTSYSRCRDVCERRTSDVTKGTNDRRCDMQNQKASNKVNCPWKQHWQSLYSMRKGEQQQIAATAHYMVRGRHCLRSHESTAYVKKYLGTIHEDTGAVSKGVKAQPAVLRKGGVTRMATRNVRTEHDEGTTHRHCARQKPLGSRKGSHDRKTQ